MLAQAARPEPRRHLGQSQPIDEKSRSARRALSSGPPAAGVFPSIQPLQNSMDTTIPPRRL